MAAVTAMARACVFVSRGLHHGLLAGRDYVPAQWWWRRRVTSPETA